MFHDPDASMEPYEQGEFDAFCGLYAIINAIRKALGHNHDLQHTAWESLFTSLVEEIDKMVGVSNVVKEGIGTSRLLGLLGRATVEIQYHYGIRLDVSRPFLRRGKQPIVEVVRHLRDYTNVPSSAVLIGLSGTLGHWTVIDRITKNYISLFDSGGHTRVQIDRCRMGYEPDIETATQHILRSGAVVRLLVIP